MKLVLEDLALRAGSFSLGPLSLAIAEGEYLIALGPSGAGKTTLLEAIAGLRAVHGGRVLMDGQDMTRLAPEARHVGYLFQESLLFPHLCVRGNIAYGAHRIPAHERAGTIARLARAVGVEPLLDRMPRGLSGGERQRVALARALATNPALLLLDEPMAALDPNARHALRTTLLQLHCELGTTTVHVTHNFAEALALGDRVAILIDGKILQSGPTAQVFAQPASPVIAGFLRSAPPATQSEPPSAETNGLTLCPRGLKLAVNPNAEDSGVPELRAEGAALSVGAAPQNTGELVVGKLVAMSTEGAALRVALNVGLRLTVKIPLSEPGVESLVEGASVRVQIPKQP